MSDKCRKVYEQWVKDTGYDKYKPVDPWEAWQAAWNCRAPQWMPIDIAPKTGIVDIFGRFIGGDYQRIPGCYWEPFYNQWYSPDHRKYVLQASHFMPLPSAPKEKS